MIKVSTSIRVFVSFTSLAMISEEAPRAWVLVDRLAWVLVRVDVRA